MGSRNSPRDAHSPATAFLQYISLYKLVAVACFLSAECNSWLFFGLIMQHNTGLLAEHLLRLCAL